MLFEECNELHASIAKTIWKIMPLDASKYIFECELQPDAQNYRMYWIDQNGEEKNYPLGGFPEEKREILNFYSNLKETMAKFGSDWTQSRFTLDKNGKFDVKFAYVPDEDSWPMLYLRGVSDLEENEINEYGIPREIWEERVKAKKEQQNS